MIIAKAQYMSNLLVNLLDLLFPPRCCVCGKYGHDPMCDVCTSNIQFLSQPYCRICGKPKDKYFTGDLCEDCSNEKPAFTLARSVAIYEGLLKEAIHEFKFNGKKKLCDPLGKIMIDHIFRSDIPLIDIDTITPIPLSNKRQKERGYNQSLLLVENISSKLYLKVNAGSLFKVKNIKPQHDLLRQERLTNIQGAFVANNVEGFNILLIDDIYTTGATVKEASSVLRHAGAKNIYVLTLARALFEVYT